jgi:hypothetical protein
MSKVQLLTIISGTGAAFWSETNLGPTGHHHPRSSPLFRICTIPSTYVIFTFILEVMVCEAVQHRLRLRPDNHSCAQMA